MRSALFLFVLALPLGCSSRPAGAPVAASADAPTPYTADEIRKASPVGRRLDFAVTAPGKPRTLRVMSFIAADEAGAEIELVTLDETGHQTGPGERKRATWAELRDHASFPREATTVSEATLTVPAGTFPCRVYVVKSGKVTMTFWFATTLPGPPVKTTTEEGGTVTESRELFRHVAR